MKGFFGIVAIIGLLLAGADHPDATIFYIINILAVACLLSGVAGLLVGLMKEEK